MKNEKKEYSIIIVYDHQCVAPHTIIHIGDADAESQSCAKHINTPSVFCVSKLKLCASVCV